MEAPQKEFDAASNPKQSSVARYAGTVHTGRAAGAKIFSLAEIVLLRLIARTFIFPWEYREGTNWVGAHEWRSRSQQLPALVGAIRFSIDHRESKLQNLQVTSRNSLIKKGHPK